MRWEQFNLLRATLLWLCLPFQRIINTGMETALKHQSYGGSSSSSINSACWGNDKILVPVCSFFCIFHLGREISSFLQGYHSPLTKQASFRYRAGV
uniref:Secreted protein n=1 Tax=Anopheles atroparvus TaxID=41427 RepID=A0AAG5D4Q5_ANOAO